MDLTDDLGAITAPTLLITGADDRATPPDHACTIAARIAGARVCILSGAAHLANVEQPTAFTDAVLDHLCGSGSISRERGMTVRRTVLGDEHVDEAISATVPFTAPLQDLITRVAWGEVWSRRGLDRRMRSAATLAMLVALGRDDELAMHVRAARNVGLTVAEIQELLLHSAVYCGVPAAHHAFAIAERVLADDLDAAPEENGT